MENLKKSRTASFIVVLLVYLLSIIFAVDIFAALSLPLWLELLVADVAATLLTFVFSLLLKNASVYDPYWSVQPLVILAGLAIMGCEITLPRLLILIAVGLWGIRLTANWAYTFHGLCHQDWRYTMLHEKTGRLYPLVNLFGIHMVPTLIVWGCTLPAVYILQWEATWNPGSVIFFILCIGAVLLQGTADIQMHRFRKAGRGGFIRAGLWKHSRHPNYLGEILMWWGVALSCVCLFPTAWYLCAGALANTLLFLTVSIPMADKRQARKEGFAEYKAQTRMLLPIPVGAKKRVE